MRKRFDNSMVYIKRNEAGSWLSQKLDDMLSNQGFRHEFNPKKLNFQLNRILRD